MNVCPVKLPCSGREIMVSLRRSEKASRCTLRITEKGPELVLPLFLPEEEGLVFLKNCSLWLEKHLKKTPARSESEMRKTYPDHFSLAALGREVAVRYQFMDVNWLGARLDDRVLTVSGNVLDHERIGEALENCILREAQKFLPPLLQKLSGETSMKYRECSVRLQKTRWGSCSSRGTISLNAMLLFVPPDCVRYVLIHELCHTRHMNHSSLFWAEVAKYVPEWKYLRSLLKRTPIPAFSSICGK